MADWNPFANSIFLTVRDLPPGEARASYLNEACGANAALRQAVVELLDADASADGFLESPVAWAASADRPDEQYEKSGDRLGPYTLRELVGEGGMGLVYAAEQTEPVVRQVAVKIIKPGMDSRKVIARFEAERQALAMMDHPHIAKVFDAGTTAAGRPYFVMELVTGPPISVYCDEHKLSIRDRLELFLPVCHAVQHAHQKGIIHRDLKPSNVVIAQYDGRPVPKVIDFGVAKATVPKLTDRTLHTEHGIVIGTLEYMSPEQAELNQLDIDTRSDVYSLGVILYELIAGTTPLDPARLRSTPFDELRRIIREEPPVKPSARLSHSAALPALAANRGVDPPRLSRQLRADLDWIIMKSLEKDRNRRYESASALARDIKRFLANEPIEARPPSLAYRFRKFSHRNRAAVFAAALVAVSMLAGTAVSIWQSVRAARAERAALAFAQAERQARRAESAQRQLAEDRLRFLVMALGVATPEIDPANVTDAVLQQSWESILSGLEMAPGARAALLLSVGRSYANMGRDEAAVRELRRCLEIAEDPSVIHNAKYYLATSCLFLGKTDEGTAILRDLLRQKLDRISGSDVDELRAAWPGLDSAQARPTDRPGQRGLELDGVDDYVVLPNLQFDGRPPWTLEAIVNAAAIDQYKSRAATNWTSLISTTDGGGIGLDTHAGKWSIELYAPEKYHSQWASDYVRASARLAPALGRWQHLAGVWDGKVLRFYVDGKLQETRQGVEVCSSLSEGPFMLGADPADLDFDEVAEGLFHGVIRAARISRAAEYAKSFPKPHRLEKTPQAVGLYDFTIDTGRYAIDRSGHNHHGIIVGARFVPANE